MPEEFDREAAQKRYDEIEAEQRRISEQHAKLFAEYEPLHERDFPPDSPEGKRKAELVEQMG